MHELFKNVGNEPMKIRDQRKQVMNAVIFLIHRGIDIKNRKRKNMLDHIFLAKIDSINVML